MPFATNALISPEGCGSITQTRRGSNPCAGQPDSIGPPILPAPASMMGPVISFKALLMFKGLTTNTNVVPAWCAIARTAQGPITTDVSSEPPDRPQAPCSNIDVAAYGSLRSQGRPLTTVVAGLDPAIHLLRMNP